MGQTSVRLKDRFRQHLYKIKNNNKFKTYLYQHFRKTGHSYKQVTIQPVEEIVYDPNTTLSMRNKVRLVREFDWIKKLQTPFPIGLNDNLFQFGNISRNSEFDIFSIFHLRKRKSRSHGKRKNHNIRRKSKIKISLHHLNSIFKNSGIHTALSKIASLSISSLRILCNETDKFVSRDHPLYDIARLVDNYALHYLKPHIDDTEEHRRHFLKINFLNKGVDFINLPSILNDKNVRSLIPTYFKNQETPMICYKYNNPIRNLIFNYNSVVSDPDILNTLPDTCNCSSSKFCYKPFGHIVTGNLDVISNVNLRRVISKGPKYRLPQDINFEKCFTNIEDSLNEFSNKWCKRENTTLDALGAWKTRILKTTRERILFYKNNPSLLPPKARYTAKNLKTDILDVHDKFVLVPADKASNNAVVI